MQRYFYDRDGLNTIEVARGLLGHYLCHETASGLISGIIVETEAYLSNNDPASHAFKGITGRNVTMFGPAGRAYIYFIYGNYYCFNVVTGLQGSGEAVLIRAVEPLSGIELMLKNRGVKCEIRNLTNGPGKICIAYGIDKRYDGHDLRKKPLYLAENSDYGRLEIKVTPRIGISSARDKLLRFIIKGNNYLSRREPIG
ncbi:MAG: DNA-3-methyladenine glycosylase [Bacillota bacterium]|nr:DNA-3-methyladenine glycosylase [Bacillota bacterium]